MAPGWRPAQDRIMPAIPPAADPGEHRSEDQSSQPPDDRSPDARLADEGHSDEDRPDERHPDEGHPGAGASGSRGWSDSGGGADSLIDDLRALRRARDGRVLAGVCAGVGRQLRVDPVVLRVVVAVLTLFGGVGVVLYGAGWLLLPSEDDDSSILEQQLGRRRNGTSDSAVVVAGLVVLGVIVLSVPWWGLPWHVPALLVLSILGLVMLVRRNADHGGDANGVGSAGAPGPPDTYGTDLANPPTQVLDDPTWRADLRQTDTAGGTVASTAATPTSWRDAPPAPASFWNQPDPLGLESGDDPDPAPPVEWTPPPAPVRARKQRSWLFAGTVVAILVVEAILTGISDEMPLPAGTFVAAALAVVGAGLILGTWVGRTRALTALGIVLALALVPASAADHWPGGTVDARLQPTSVGMVNPLYKYGAGSLLLDLTEVPFDEYPRAVRTSIELGMGDVHVLVPSTVDVQFTGRVGLGHLSAFQANPLGSFDSRPFTRAPSESAEPERERESGDRTMPPPEPVAPEAPEAPVAPGAPSELGPLLDRPGGVESEGNDLTERFVELGSDGPGGGRLVLDIEVGFGQLEVQRVS
jgi:phage shock protein PspC (stress-responsive transcriptional regulator)